MYTHRLKSRVAIVTGGADGIGRAIAIKLADEGAAVVIADRQVDKASAVAAEIRASGGSSLAVSLELTDDDCGRKLVLDVIAHYQHIDCVVFCAGITEMKDWLDITSQEWDRMFDINIRGTFLCLQEVAKQMMLQSRGGAIVNLTSTSGHGPRPDTAHYGASKAALIHLTRSVALGLGKKRIRVNGISPGLIKTSMWEQVARQRSSMQDMSPEEYESHVVADIPLGRPGEPNDVAQLAAFLLSDDASYITGQIIVLDGGYSLKVS